MISGRLNQDALVCGLIAGSDPELMDWLWNVTDEGAGDFLIHLALAAVHADSENYALLRPALLVLKAKYPAYDHPYSVVGGRPFSLLDVPLPGRPVQLERFAAEDVQKAVMPVLFWFCVWCKTQNEPGLALCQKCVMPR